MARSFESVTVINDCNMTRDIEDPYSDEEIDGSMSESDTVINGSAETLNLRHE